MCIVPEELGHLSFVPAEILVQHGSQRFHLQLLPGCVGRALLIDVPVVDSIAKFERAVPYQRPVG